MTSASPTPTSRTETYDAESGCCAHILFFQIDAPHGGQSLLTAASQGISRLPKDEGLSMDLLVLAVFAVVYLGMIAGELPGSAESRSIGDNTGGSASP